MDEPTTHLDLLTIESLILALERYEGTLLFISHDVYFIRRLATKILHVKHGRLTLYAGDYDYFLEKTHSEENDRAGHHRLRIGSMAAKDSWLIRIASL